MVRNRLRLLMLLLGLPFLAILGRLFQLQVIEADGYRRIAESMGRRLELIRPTRGRLLDRFGAPLADNEVRFDIVFTLDELHPRERDFANLQRLFGLCQVEAHRARYELCTCGILEAELLRLAPPPSMDEGGAPDAGARRLFIESIPASSFRRFSRHSLQRLEGLGMTFEKAPSGSAYLLYLEPAKAMEMERTLLRLSRLTGQPLGTPGAGADSATLLGRVAQAADEVQRFSGGADAVESQRLTETRNYLRSRERVLVENAARDAVTEILYRSERYPGVRIRRRLERRYPQGDAAGIVTGYGRPVFREQLEEWSERGVLLDVEARFRQGAQAAPCSEVLSAFESLREDARFPQEFVGVRGLEKSLDEGLRGRFGLRLVLEDARHQPLPQQPFQPTEAREGVDASTTIDAALQRTIFEGLASACGDFGHARAGSAAVMALKASSGARNGQPGAILALVSYPSFDPGRMGEPEYLKTLEEDTRKPQFARPFSPPRLLPPGSVFKLVVAIAALESGQVRRDGRWTAAPLDAAETYECRYIFEDGGERRYRCNHRPGHGAVDLAGALKVSCNCYFYWLSRERLNSQLLWAWAHNLGFGRPAGSPEPRHGLPPGPEGRLDRSVPAAAMPAYSIGHIFVESTPLQVLRAVAAIALSGGALPSPYLVEARPPEPTGIARSATLAPLREGMRRALQEPGGTAAKPEFGLSRFQAAVKTGTSQIEDGLDEYFSWVAGFAPLDDPEIAFVICLENTPLHGGEATAAVLRRILDHFASSAPERFLRPEGHQG
jgi:cell division protein FtsI/penicillin-binding protein 2